ncbi:MAG: T9SS type A sorting domain-containing protein [Candidatus Delongbacteria bacterium]|nr:T9SS type A sorting domain-containing protein [Candidatus Delongbacteria bacterium]
MKKIFITISIVCLFSLNCSEIIVRSSVGQSVIGEFSFGESTIKTGIIYLVNTGVNSKSNSKTGAVENTPYSFVLEQNYPNPFNPTTLIEFSIPTDQYVSLKVYNILGNEVAELAGKNYSKGIHNVNFNANKCVSGLYFYRMQTKEFSNIKKMMIVK